MAFPDGVISCRLKSGGLESQKLGCYAPTPA